MSEELKKGAFNLFASASMTFAEAQEKAKQEAGSPKVERFRIGEDGEYSIRILPLAPVIGEDGAPLPMDRKGYEYPIHQLFLGITVPGKGKTKPKKINIPVVRATDKGIDKSVDLIDTYVKIAKEMYADDQELMSVVTGNSFGGGLRWTYQHAMMVLDLSSDKERAKGPQLWQCSHSQYKDIDAAKLRLWHELNEDGEQDTCPISWFTDAYPVKVIRTTDKKTEYTIEIGRKTVDVKEEEAEKLLELPRIPELINRFTNYQLEAEICFLAQYDELHDMEVCKQTDFIEAVEKIKGEMPADDTSHFDLANVGNSGNGSGGEVTIDSLWDEYDRITDEGLSEKSAEYQELREKIRQFAEDNELDVRLSRSKNNKQLLEEIEDELDGKKSQGKTVNKEKAAEKASKKEIKVVVENDEEDESQDEAVEESDNDNDAEEEEKKEAAPRRRRSRPTEEPEEEDEEEEEQPKAEEPEEEERPLHRRRRR